MTIEAVSKSLPGLPYQKSREIFWFNRRCIIAVLIALGAFGPKTALGGNSATRPVDTVAVFSHPTRPGRPSISARPTDPRPDPSQEDRFVNQLYENLMRESARVLNAHE